MGRARGDEGQASVEMVALLPLLALLAWAGWQAIVAGQAVWLAGAAARDAARAQALGRDPVVAARAALPARLRRELRVERDDGDGVRVRITVPVVLLAGDRTVGTVVGRAHMEPQT